MTEFESLVQRIERLSPKIAIRIANRLEDRYRPFSKIKEISSHDADFLILQELGLIEGGGKPYEHYITYHSFTYKAETLYHALKKEGYYLQEKSK